MGFSMWFMHRGNSRQNTAWLYQNTFSHYWLVMQEWNFPVFFRVYALSVGNSFVTVLSVLTLLRENKALRGTRWYSEKQLLWLLKKHCVYIYMYVFLENSECIAMCSDCFCISFQMFWPSKDEVLP